jgi:hypothetical protein
VLQQLEQHDMASDIQNDRRAASARKEIRTPPSPARPLPGGPPIVNDGLETPRSSHC